MAKNLIDGSNIVVESSENNINLNLSSTYTNALNQQINTWKGTLLWTNSSPTSSFSAQDINLSSSDYDLLEVIWWNKANEKKAFSTKILKGSGARLYDVYVSNASKFGIRSRGLTYSSDIKYTATECLKYVMSDNAVTTENDACVPLYIIGYKTGLFN